MAISRSRRIPDQPTVCKRIYLRVRRWSIFLRSLPIFAQLHKGIREYLDPPWMVALLVGVGLTLTGLISTWIGFACLFLASGLLLSDLSKLVVVSGKIRFIFSSLVILMSLFFSWDWMDRYAQFRQEPGLSKNDILNALKEGLRGIRTPFRLSNVEINVMSDGHLCPSWCKDEIDLDGAGMLFPMEAGRGYVMGFTDKPTLVLKHPKPGKIPLPKSPRPSGNEPYISVDTIDVPPGFKGVLHIRQPQQTFRFEVADKRSHRVKAGNRSFLVSLTGTVGEDPEGQHTIFTYGFNVAEQVAEQ